MTALQTIGKLIQPTLSSMLTVFTGALFVIGSSILAANSKNGFLYELLLGSEEFSRQQSSINEAGYLIDTEFFGSAGLNEVLYLMFWMALGVLAYLIVSSIGSGISNTSADVEQLGYVNANKNKIIKQRASRVLIRTFVALGWAIYSIVFMKFIMPFSVMSGLVGAIKLPAINGLLWLIVSVVIFSIFTHLHVVFARMFFLKFRIWGGENYLSESSHHI